MDEVIMYTDGSCRGNPGPGGYACLLLYTDADGAIHEKVLTKGYKNTTNNRMELLAVVSGLEALKRPCKVTVYSDSQYIVNALTKGWLDKWRENGWYKDARRKQKAKNQDLWQRYLLASEGHIITYSWVKGHADNELNNRCDQLAVLAASDTEHQEEDIGND